MSGYFNVPQINGISGCGSRDPGNIVAKSSAWVGIGGSTNDGTLVQTGIEADVGINRSGLHAVYYAWYEALPGAQQQLPVRICPGDEVLASVEETSTDVWDLTVQDVTTGRSASHVLGYHSLNASAEAILENTNCQISACMHLTPTSNLVFDRVE